MPNTLALCLERTCRAPCLAWRRLQSFVITLTCALGLPFAALAQTPARAPSADRVIDAFVSIREFGLVRASPDGAFLAVEVMRPYTSRARIGVTSSMSLSDLWLVDMSSGQTRQLTSGAQDGTSAWEPIWSPDSSKIAYLTNAGDGLPRAAWMDVRSRRGGLLSSRGVDIEVNFGSRSPYNGDRRLWGAWISRERFIMAASAPGELSPQARTMAPELVYAPLWSQARNGEAPVTVWDSASNLQCSTRTSLLSLDVGARPRESELFVGSLRAVTLAPDRRHAAMVLATGALAPPSLGVIDREMNYSHLDPRVHTQLAMLALRGRSATNVATQTTGVRFQSAIDAPRWTSDSNWLFAPRFEQVDGVMANFCVDPVTAGGAPADQWRIDCARIRSREHAQLLALSLSVAPPNSVEALEQRLVHTASAVQSTDTQLEQEVAIFSLGRGLVGVASANWIKLVELETGQSRDQADFDNVALLLSGAPGSDATVAVVRTIEGLHVLRAQESGLILEAITPPEASLAPTGIVPQSNALVWTSEDLHGKSLWISDSAGQDWRRVLRLERPFPADLQFQRQALQYTLPDGRSAIAILLLPPNYDSARPYPIILDVYPGQNYREESVNTQFNPNNVHGVEAYTLASMGYVVARPSTPRFNGEPADYEPLDYYSGLVEAFAREAIARGLTSPGRIGLWGHSNGGYLGLGVAGRTRLINAIVSSSPFPDLIQVADLPAPLFKTDACAPNRLYGASLNVAEDPQGPLWRMGAPSYQALDRFIRNSPLYQLGPQAPPTLIVQGEYDGRGTADAERVYTRLNRQQVPVQVARYWGEGHNFLNGASIRDRVHRAIDWYGRHLIDTPRPDASPQ